MDCYGAREVKTPDMMLLQWSTKRDSCFKQNGSKQKFLVCSGEATDDKWRWKEK